MSKKKYELRKEMKSVRWMIFWVVLAQLAAEIAVQAVISFMSNPPHEYIQIAIVEIIAIGVPIVIYGKSAIHLNKKSIKDDLKLNRCRMDFLGIAMVLGITGQFVMMLLNIPANLYISNVLNKESVDAIPIAQNLCQMILGAIAVVVVPAILEEFWIRGILFSAYERSNTWGAVIFTTLVFALMHMRLNEFVGFLFMGIMSLFVLVRTKSLYAAMVYHAFSNLAALVFGFMLAYVIDYILLIFIIAVVVFIFFLLLLCIKGEKMRVYKEFGFGELMLNSILSLPIILSFILLTMKYFLIK